MMRVGRNLSVAACLGVVLIGGQGCNYSSEPGDYNPPPPAVPVQGLRVLPQTIQFTAIGESRMLTATVSPANATDQAITWESADSTVVAVDAFGRVTARAVGSGVLITAISRDGGHQSSANATVVVTQPNVPVDGVKVSTQSIQLSAIGETQLLTATISPANASDQTVIWESTDSTVVSVDASGRVTARAVGSGVFITAFSHDRGHQASANARVNP
jgi:alpha-amylase